MKTVYDLTPAQLAELKQTYAVQLAETEGEEIFWGDLADAENIIPDAVIFEHYDGIIFSDDDFSCTAEV